MTKATAEVANLSNDVERGTSSAPSEIYPRHPGMRVSNDELRSIVWRFPLRLKGMKPDAKPKPVRDARIHKLDSYMCDQALPSGDTETVGEKGSKTRTWFSLPDKDVFAVAGMWRDTDDGGRAFSMAMTEVRRSL